MGRLYSTSRKPAQGETPEPLGVGFLFLLVILLFSLGLTYLTFARSSKPQAPLLSEATPTPSEEAPLLEEVPLRVSQVFPAMGSREIDPASAITVVFNRPAVPLTTLEQQDSLPNPLQFVPELAGKARWLTTSVLVFQPSKPMLSGQTYQVTVRQDWGTFGAKLEEDFVWSFSTRPARVEGIQLQKGEIDPPSGKEGILLDEAITLRFSQPMDRQSTERATSVLDEKAESMPLDYQWSEDFTQLTIRPKRLYRVDSPYQLVVRKEALTQSGSPLSEEFRWDFRTLPMPTVVQVSPREGEVQSDFSPWLFIKFSSPMKIDSFKERVIIRPQPKQPVEWWYDEWEYGFSFYNLEPSTQYEIEIQPGIEDIYGNRLLEGKTFSFTTAPLPPSAYLRMPGETVFYRSDPKTQYFYLTLTNVRQAIVKLFPLSLEDFSGMVFYEKNYWEYSPTESPIWVKEVTGAAGLNETKTVKVELATEEGALSPGLYFLALDTPEIAHPYSPFLDQRIVIVANANLTLKTTPTEALAWITDLESGEPLPNVAVRVIGSGQKELGSGVTDQNGVARIEYFEASPENIAVAYTLGNEVVSYATTQWGSGAAAVDYALWEGYYSVPGLTRAYVYTERPIYRPGQPVYFKAILRTDDDLKYQLPQLERVKVRIQSFDKVVWEEEFLPSKGGTINGRFVLAEDAALGTYFLSVLDPKDETILGEVSFSVAEYRRPEFRVKVSAEPLNLVRGERGRALVRAEYYSGGAVTGGKLKWSITSQPFVFVPEADYHDYSFADTAIDQFEEDAQDRPLRVVSEGEGVLDANGQAEIEYLAELEEGAESQSWTIEADVTDIAGNVVSGRQQVTVHQSQVYVGIKPDWYIGEAGREQSLSLIALDWQSKPINNQSIEVSIAEQRWHSVQVQRPDGSIVWESKVEEIPLVESERVTTGEDGKVQVSFVPPNGGVFRARACARDAGDREHCASTYLWVYSGDFVPWRQTSDRSMQIVADKKEYQAGDVAQILIASPFQGKANALVTVERGHIRSYELVRLNSNSVVYSLPIDDSMAPNIYVSVMVVKGVDEANPRPSFRVGLAELKVETQSQRLLIEVEKDKASARPGEEVTYTLSVRDSEGNPVRAELSVALSDLATLSLVPPNSSAIEDFFYNRRALGVRTSTPLLLSMEDYNALAEEELVAGPAMGSGGGKGEGILGVVEVRQEFPDTAFWEARLFTDERGIARFSVQLPDNLTIWRLDARAVTEDTRVGQTTDDLPVSKPLMVLPKTPRFFVVGDLVEVGATVRNQTGQALQVQVELKAQGVEVLDPLTQVVGVESGQQVFLKWKVRPLDVERVDLIFAAVGGEWQDASKPTLATLPEQGLAVYRYESREVVATAGRLKEAGSRQETLRLPRAEELEGGELTIRLQPSLGAGILDGLSYLEYFPHACLEQTVSRFLPNLMVAQAYRMAGIQDSRTAAKLDELVRSGLQRVYRYQNPDGGWGWWSREKSDLQTSAYAMLGLIEAKRAGYSVDEEVFRRGMQFLRLNLKSVSTLKYPHEFNSQAFVLYVMARAGAANEARVTALYEKRQVLANYAQAFLAETLFRLNPQDQRIQTLVSDLRKSAIQSATGVHWQEKEADEYNWNTDVRTTAIVLGVLETINPDDPLLEGVVRWLVQNRLQKAWEGTQETAWTIMALARWLETQGELEGEYEVSLAINYRQVERWKVGRENLEQAKELRIATKELIADALNRIVLTKSNDTGSLYYTIHLSVPQPVAEIRSLSQGLVVYREYFRPENPQSAITEAHVGDVIYGRLTIVVPNDTRHLVVEDPLPAGLEAIDQSLLTAAQSEPPAKVTWEDLLYRGWGWWWNFDHIELRDEKIVLAASFLPAGTYIYTYPLRVVHVGEFQTLPPIAYEFYFPEVFGRGEGMSFRVLP